MLIRENDFDAYGNVTREQDWTSDNFSAEFGGSQNDLLFSTKERDFSTGLDYFGFRYYDAVLGKFSTDVISRESTDTEALVNKC